MVSDVLQKHRFIVFGAEHYNPLGIVRSLGEEGIRPIVITINGKEKITSASKYCGEIYHVNSLEDGYNLILKNYTGGY